MAGFAVIKDSQSKPFTRVTINSTSHSYGDLIELVNGTAYWAACTSSSNYFTRKAICMETVSSGTSILVRELDGTEIVSAESANNSNSTHNGDNMVLTDTNTVNNTGSTSTAQTACFVQDGTIGVNTDKLIYGRVIVGKGVDPDAT